MARASAWAPCFWMGTIMSALSLQPAVIITLLKAIPLSTQQGVQKAPSAQWTAAAGAVLLEAVEAGRPQGVTVGKVIDMGQTDANDMNGTMAAAAVHTIKTHLDDLNLESDYYDLIVSGDLE